MMMKMGFKKWHFLLFAILLLSETAIAVLSENPFIRGFLGDVLVVPLLYSFLKTIFLFSSKKTMLAVLTFAFLVEFLQFFRLGEILNIQSKVLLTILGSVFDPLDLVAYFLGFLIILFIEGYFHINKGNPFYKS